VELALFAVVAADGDDVELREGGSKLDNAGGTATSLGNVERILSLGLRLDCVGNEVLSGADDVGIMGGIRRASSSTGMLLSGAGCALLLSLFVMSVVAAASKPKRKRRSETRRRTGDEGTAPVLLEPAAWLPSNTGGAAGMTVANRGNPRSIRWAVTVRSAVPLLEDVSAGEMSGNDAGWTSAAGRMEGGGPAAGAADMGGAEEEEGARSASGGKEFTLF